MGISAQWVFFFEWANCQVGVFVEETYAKFLKKWQEIFLNSLNVVSISILIFLGGRVLFT